MSDDSKQALTSPAKIPSGRELLAKLSPTEQRDLDQIYSTLRARGFECYLVGGCVRDLILGRHGAGDMDLTTNAHPKQVQRLFARTVPTGIRHGTVTILIERRPYEITTYRAESDYTDGRRPDHVSFAKTLEEDLLRRDFTMNAISLEPKTGELIDLHGGLADIQNKRIRTIGSAHERFFEDGLRPIRACRFLSTLGFELAPEVRSAIRDPAVRARTAKIAIERFSDELWKGLKGRSPERMIRELEESALLAIFFTRDAIINTEKNYNNSANLVVEKKILNPTPKGLFDGLPEGFAGYKMALWWKAIGIDTKARVERLAKRLRFSGKKTRIISLYQEALDFQKSLLCEKDVQKHGLLARRFLSQVKQRLRDETLSFLDGLPPKWDQETPCTRDKLKEIYHTCALVVSDLALGGNDMQALGYKGPAIGHKLSECLALVLEDPSKNEKSFLKEIL